MSASRGIRANMRDLATAHVAVKPLWFLFILLSTRLLGAAEFGRTMLALSFVSIIAVILEGGVDLLVVRELSARPQAYSVIFRHSLLYKSLSGLLVGALALALSFVPALGAPSRELIAPAIAYSLFNTIMLHVRSVFRAFEVMQYEAVSIGVEKALVMVLCGIALAFCGGALDYLGAMAVAYGLALFWTLILLRRFRTLPSGPVQSDLLWREVLKPALPFALMNLFSVIYFRSGTLMLKSLTGQDTLVGHYNAGYRLVESYMLFPTIITAPIYPVLARRLAAGQAVADLVGPAARAVLLFTLLITVPLALFRGFFTRLLFGAEFAPAADAVGLVVLAMIPVGLTFVYGALVAAAGRQARANAWIVGATLLNLALNAALIPLWGANGAAATTVLTECVVLTGNAWVVRDLARGRLRAAAP